jgi:hypothetical protein
MIISLKQYALIAGTSLVIGVSTIAATGLASAQGQEHSDANVSIGLKHQKDHKFKKEDPAKHQEMVKKRLAQAVSSGKLTQEQADKLLAKQQEMKSFMESIKDKTPAQKKELIKQHRDEFKKWAEENNIPKPDKKPFKHGKSTDN